MRPGFDPHDPELLRAWQQGAEEFNSARYWSAHESWERGWKRLPEPQRTSVQALIQFAAACHLLEKGRVDPALRLCRASLDKLSRSGAARASPPALVIHGAESALRELLAPQGSARWRDRVASAEAELLLPPTV